MSLNLFTPFLFFCLITACSGSCSDHQLDACVNVEKRSSIPCGRGLCDDRTPCIWCMNNGTGTCLNWDPCNNASMSNMCPTGYIQSTGTYDCDSITTKKIIGLSILSLIPSAFYALITWWVLRSEPLKRCKIFPSILSGISVFILFVCGLTLFQDLTVWSYLWIPTTVIPLGIFMVAGVGNIIADRLCPIEWSPIQS